MATPQFGHVEPGATYPDRPAAFAVVIRDNQIALVRVERRLRGIALDLPGGGIDDGEIRNTRGAFFVGRVVVEDPALKVEDDHTLVWMTPHEAVVRLDRDSHAWAVAAWLRLRARP